LMFPSYNMLMHVVVATTLIPPNVRSGSKPCSHQTSPFFVG
jgi:hypothetical protein